ncbi:MAG TPA: hypothetical protein VD908_04330 [Cytophagales bacterium]|nr:hypothetical protein [Cytophagales bacterium]
MVQNSALKFKISSKKLSSGKCQVKFSLKEEKRKEVYGYALVDSKLTLKEVVDHLTYQIKTRSFSPYYLNRLLKKEPTLDSPIKNFLIFNS